MSTNDKTNAYNKLKTALKSVNCKIEFNHDDIKNGACNEFLKMYHYIFLIYSPHIANEILNKHNLELTHKTDKYFIDGIYKLFRDMLNYSPKVNKEQFIQTGFMVAKCNMCADIIELVRKKAKSIQPSCNSTIISTVSNKPNLKTSSSASSALNNICTNLKETSFPITNHNNDEKIISPKLNNQQPKIGNTNMSVKQITNSSLYNNLKNQLHQGTTLKKSQSVRENTPYFLKNKQNMESESNNPIKTSIDSTLGFESMLEPHLKTINQTLMDINNKLISFDKRLSSIEEDFRQKNSSISSSMSSISIDNDNYVNSETVSKLQKKIENILARFDLLENENKLMKQNQLTLNNAIMNNQRADDINDSETTLNDYETPGNSFLNISGVNNQLLNDSNGNTNQFLIQNNKKTCGLVQGVIQTNTITSTNNKYVDIGNSTIHSNDSTPTLRDQSPNKIFNGKLSSFNNENNINEISDVMRAKQLVMRATHLNEAFSSSLKI